MNWEQYKKRRGGMTLQAFANGCATEQEVLDRFAERQVSNPPLEEIKKMFTPVSQAENEKTVTNSVTVPKKSKASSDSTSN